MRRVLTTVLAGIVLAGTACSGEGGAAGSLERVIADEAPPGFRPATEDDGFPVGPFDLEGFLETYSTNESGDEALLEEHGFEAGYTRTWLAEGTGTVATVIGFDFEEDAGAEAVAEAFNSEALAEPEAREFEVPGLPGATGIRGIEEGEDGPQYIQTVTLVAGSRLFTAAVVRPTEGEETELVVSLARRQAVTGERPARPSVISAPIIPYAGSSLPRSAGPGPSKPGCGDQAGTMGTDRWSVGDQEG